MAPSSQLALPSRASEVRVKTRSAEAWSSSTTTATVKAAVTPQAILLHRKLPSSGRAWPGYAVFGPASGAPGRLFDLDALGLLVVHPALDGDLQQAVLEARGDIAAVYALGELYPPLEMAVVALPRVVLRRLWLALALAVDDQGPAVQRDFHVLAPHAGQLAAYHQVIADGEDVGSWDPGRRVRPGSFPLAAAPLGVLAHPGHLAHGVHDPPERVAHLSHLPSF